MIPTFRRPQLLRRAIRSVLAQTHTNLTVCVYDNASGDETASVVADCAAIDPRVVYVRRELHTKAVDNFLFGMERVKTAFFSFLSDDDVLFPQFYAAAVAELTEHPEAMFAAGSAIEFDEEGRVQYAPLAFWPRPGLYAPPAGLFAMLGNKHPTWTAILFRTAVIAHVGTLDPAAEWAADLDYELRAAAHGPYRVFFQPCAGYMHHAGQMSASEDARVISSYRRIAENIASEKSLAPAIRSRAVKLLSRQLRLKMCEIAVKSIVRGRDDTAREASLNLSRGLDWPLVGALLMTVSMACERWPIMRRALAKLESFRLARRSLATRAGLRRTIGEDGSAYARFLAP